ncbi:MAG: hypothetical protein K2N51_14910 [Lachnospiraceae bacterium]|nr:hypothetical protein [Lachnospiraceae bacterium]
MEQRKSYQLYLLEGEQQRAEFEYQNACRADESVHKRLNDYKFYLRMSVIYAILTVVFVTGAFAIGFMAGGTDLVILVVPFIFLMSIVSVILWLGMIWKSIKFGISYRKLKEKKEQTEADLFCAGQKLNNIQIKIDNLKGEIELEEEQKTKKNTQISEENQQDALVCKQEALGYRIGRLKKDYDEAKTELHRVMKEEFQNELDKKRYGKLTIAGVVILIILAVIQSLDVTIFSTVASRVVILLMPWCIIIPYSIGWLSKAMNTFWGEKLWINQFVFREMYNYSIAGRIQQCRENMKQTKEDIAVLEKEKEEVIKELQLFSKSTCYHE